MRKSPINVSPALREAVTDMSTKASVQLVGLVLRFNGDDRTIRDLWSEPSNTPKHKYNPHHADRLQVYRHNNDADAGRGERAANKIVDLAGYHAEELLIICWAALLRGSELDENQLRRVDLVLSKSPCCGRAASSMLRLEGNPKYLPIGCAAKLAAFITSKNMAIEWRIAFLALAGSDAPDYTPIGGPGVNRLMSARERELATAAGQQVTYRDTVAQPGLAQAAAWRTEAAQLQVQAQNLQGQAKGNAMAGFKKLNQQANVLEQRTQQQTAAMFSTARTQSIGQAQQGIQLLDSLSNVDVRRWQP